MLSTNNQTLRVLQIVPGTSVDGPGLRTSVYLAGCTHRCPGCQNPASWAFDGGTEMSVAQVADIVMAHGFNLTLTGGDPLLHSNTEAVRQLVEAVRAEGISVWCYTGFTIEQLQQRADLHPLLNLFEAIVEGPFIEERLSPALPFRGSDNQRIVRPDGTLITDYDQTGLS